MSPFEARLRSLVNQSSDTVERATLLAQLGAYLARVGRIDEAKRIVSETRAVGSVGAPALSVRIMILEGVIEVFAGSLLGARSWFLRAQAIGRSMGLMDLRSLASAWLLHVEMLLEDCDGMINALDDVQVGMHELIDETRARLSSTLLSISTLFGDDERASLFFSDARGIATAIGDHATISAVVFNRVVNRVARQRYSLRRDLLGVIPSEVLDLEAQIGSSYDRATGNRVYQDFQRVCLARMKILRGDSADALEMLGEVVGSSEPERREAVTVRIDRAWALLRCARADEAYSVLSTMGSDSVSELDLDDQAVYYGLLAKISATNIQLGLDSEALERSLSDVEGRYAELMNGYAETLRRVKYLS